MRKVMQIEQYSYDLESDLDDIEAERLAGVVKKHCASDTLQGKIARERICQEFFI